MKSFTNKNIAAQEQNKDGEKLNKQYIEFFFFSNILVVNLGILKLDHPTNPTFHHITIHTLL